MNITEEGRMARTLLLARTAEKAGITVTELTGAGPQATFAPMLKQFSVWADLAEWFLKLGGKPTALAHAKVVFDRVGGVTLTLD